MILAFLFSLLTFSLRAEEFVYSGAIFAKNGDNLEILVEREFGKAFVTAREPWKKWYQRIRKLNPKVNLRYLENEQEVFIQIPKEKVIQPEILSKGELFDPKKNKTDYIRFATEGNEEVSFFATDLNANSEFNSFFKPKNFEPVKELVPTYRLSAFYMGSAGTFKETTLQQVNVRAESNQNSPLSFGLSFGRNYEHYLLSGSLYLSYLNPATSSVSTTSEEVTIPLEWGGNIYFSDKRRGLLAPVIFGTDIESFSSFNTDELILGQTLETRQHIITYLTIGYDFIKEFYNGRIFLRGSIARSIFSTSNRESLTSSDQFSGWRYTAYANYKPSKGKLFYHILYKHHLLEGPTELLIQRIGFGFGLTLF